MTLSTAHVQPAAPSLSADQVEQIRREAVNAALAAVTYHQSGYDYVGHPEEPMPVQLVADRVMRKLRKESARPADQAGTD